MGLKQKQTTGRILLTFLYREVIIKPTNGRNGGLHEKGRENKAGITENSI